MCSSIQNIFILFYMLVKHQISIWKTNSNVAEREKENFFGRIDGMEFKKQGATIFPGNNVSTIDQEWTGWNLKKNRVLRFFLEITYPLSMNGRDGIKKTGCYDFS